MNIYVFQDAADALKMQQLSTNLATVDTPTSIVEGNSISKFNQQTFLPLTKGTALVVGGGCALDQSEFNQAIEEFIVSAELPFSFVERDELRVLISKIAPGYVLPSRKKVAKDIEQYMFREMGDSIKKILNNLAKEGTKFSSTTDIWTCGVQKIAYMAVTIHWIDSTWELNSLLIGFEHIEGIHNGENIANVFVKVLKEFGLENSLLSVTLDNAGNNGTFISFLRVLLQDSIACGGQLLQCRCAAHIINLVVKDGIACIAKDLRKLRVLVKSLRNPQRLEKFEKRVEDILVSTNKDYATKARPTLDVATRWNSTFDMIKSCLPYAQIFDIMGDEIFDMDDEDNEVHMRNKISVNVKGSSKCRLSKVAWMKMQLLENFLSPLKDATEW